MTTYSDTLVVQKTRLSKVNKDKFIATIYVFSMFSAFIPAVTLAAEENGTLQVSIVGFANNQGNALVALVNSKEAFEASKDGIDPYRNAKAAITENQAQVIFRAIPYGEYALKVFHDENNNGDLDTNIIGIPVERYGFSNNVRSKFGPPGYEQTLFTFDAKNSNIEITVK